MFRCRAIAAVAVLIIVVPPVQAQEQAEPRGVGHIAPSLSDWPDRDRMTPRAAEQPS